MYKDPVNKGRTMQPLTGYVAGTANNNITVPGFQKAHVCIFVYMYPHLPATCDVSDVWEKNCTGPF